MNNTPIDALQIKIERAKDTLPAETKNAINSVDWRAFVLSMREKKGYSFEQLEDLELETELLLCGLLPPADYPKELERGMGIPRSQVDLLVSEMNEMVFKKIKDELIKNTERKELFIKKSTELKTQTEIPTGAKAINTAPVENIPTQTPTPISIPVKKTEERSNDSISLQKLTNSFQMPTIKTEYSLNNLKGGGMQNQSDNLGTKIKTSRDDPYRIDPNA